jgi:hypothetical protein
MAGIRFMVPKWLVERNILVESGQKIQKQSLQPRLLVMCPPRTYFVYVRRRMDANGGGGGERYILGFLGH